MCQMCKPELVVGNEWQERNMTSTLDSGTETALLAFGQTSLLAGFDLAVYVYVALQSLKVFVVEVRNIGLVLENFSHD